MNDEFTNILEVYVNPNYTFNDGNKKFTIHEEFIHRNYPKLSQFAVRFNQWAKYEKDDKIKQIAMSDNLTREQSVNRNLVKEYQDRCSDSLVNSLVNEICLQNGNLEHDNKNLVENITAYAETNELMKKDAEEIEIKVQDLKLDYDEKIKEMDDKYKKLDEEHKKLKDKYNAFELKAICLENEYKFSEHETVAELQTKRTNETKIVDLEEKCKSLQLINEANLRELGKIKQQLNEELKERRQRMNNLKHCLHI